MPDSIEKIQKQTPASPLKKVILGGILVLFGLVLSLAAIEVGYRMLMKFRTPPPVWNDRPRFYFQAEKASTLQDYHYAVTKPENTFRMAVVGDSFSFAPFMQFTDSFPKKIEQMLRLNDSPLRAEVINYGVPAYSSSHEVEEVRKALAEGADLVLLQVTLNDPEIKPLRPIGIGQATAFGPYVPPRALSSWRSLNFVLERLHNSRTQQEYVNYFLDLFTNPRTREGFESSIRAMAKRARKKKVPMVAVVFPLFGVPIDENYPFTPIHTQLDTFFKELSIPTLDLLELYRGIPLERLQVEPGKDRHPNEIAHRMAAEEILVWLTGRELIPPELMIKKMFKGRTQIIKETPLSWEEVLQGGRR